jgi:polyisoprenoid-binding protein YceI
MASMRYVLDSKSSQLTVQAFAEGLAGIADHRPRFAVSEFSGELEFDPNQLRGGWLHMTARTESLTIMDEVTRQDRVAIERVMFGEVLHPETFPEVTFRSSRTICNLVSENRYRADITGKVSLHGIENQESIQAQLILTDQSVRAYGEFRLRQTDYGIAVASVAGGLLRIKDDIKFVFFFVARR